MNDYGIALTFDDVTLVPCHSTIKSRKDPDPSTRIGLEKLSCPIFSAPMNTVTEKEMCESMAKMGGDSVLHRYMTIDQQVEQFRSIVGKKPFVAIGSDGCFFERATELYKNGVRKFCIDVANGCNQNCINATFKLRQEWNDITVMAGNVCTGEGAIHLFRAGAHVIRVGIGPGSMCTTRLVTGFGVPQLTAIKWCTSAIAEVDKTGNVSIVADGGIRYSGDIVKAIVAGADAVMIGGLFAGTSQTPGETISFPDGSLMKSYKGMASEDGRRGWFKNSETVSFVPEGSSTLVPFKGDVCKVVSRLVGGLKVGMSFANAHTLEELRVNTKMVRITENGRVEGTTNRRLFK